MRIVPEISGVSVVLLGDFNPAIFTPAWFVLHGLLPEDVAESAELRIAHRQVTEFVAEWLRIQVTSERFFAETLQAPPVRLHATSSPGHSEEYLHHTPITSIWNQP